MLRRCLGFSHPPAGAMGPRAGGRCWAAVPALAGPPGSRPDPATPQLQERVREQIQPCKDVWIFAPGEMLDRPCRSLVLVSRCTALPKKPLLSPQKSAGTRGGGMRALKTGPLCLAIKFGLETASPFFNQIQRV